VTEGNYSTGFKPQELCNTIKQTQLKLFSGTVKFPDVINTTVTDISHMKNMVHIDTRI